MSRRLYIDWLRGLAVVAMILWHAVDAWTLDAARESGAFAAIVFTAGWVAPLFLFLAGVSIPLAGTSRMRRGQSQREAGWSLQVRGWQIFLLAHLFRLQSFVLNPNALGSSLFKPDILNVLGLGIVASAFAWSRSSGSAPSAARWLLLPAVVIAGVLTPLSRIWWWPTLLHPRLEAYIRPVESYGVFSLFPITAYIFAGAFVGVLLASRDASDQAVHRNIGLAGLLAACGGVALAYASGQTMSAWTGPLSVFAWRTGAIAMAVSLVWIVFTMRAGWRWSPLIVFGQTSLFVYWVHVELAYGVFSSPLHRSLGLGAALAAWVALAVAMLGSALLWRRRPRGWPVPAQTLAGEGR
jgi:uncharacterized membrane protein